MINLFKKSALYITSAIVLSGCGVMHRPSFEEKLFGKPRVSKEEKRNDKHQANFEENVQDSLPQKQKTSKADETAYRYE